VSSRSSPTAEQYFVTMPAHAPHAAITLEEGPGDTTRWEITEPVTIIGWGGASTLVLSDKHMSKVQCLIVHTGRYLLLRDLHSPKPTDLNGERAFIAVLADGDRISVGNTTLAVHLENGPTGDADQNGNPMRLPGALELQDTVSPEKAVIDKAVTVLGRREDLDIYLDDASISPAHAVVFHFDNRPMVRDLGSRSGVEVNGELQVLSPLNEGDLLKVGPFEVKVHIVDWPAPTTNAEHEAPAEPSPPPADQPPADQPVADEPPADQTPAGQTPSPDAGPAPRPAPRPSEKSPRRPLKPPSDLGTLDTLRHKVSLLCEELLAYRDRLALWERDLTTYSRDLAALTRRTISGTEREAGAASGSTSEDGDDVFADALEPVQALEQFSDALDRAQEVLGPVHGPELSAQEQGAARQPADKDAEAGPQGDSPESEPDAQADQPSPESEAAGKTAEQKRANAARSDEPVRARPATPKAGPNPKDGQAPPANRLLDPKYSLQAVINSMDLDPEVADQLRLLRRLNPGAKDGELLQRVLAEMQQTTAKSKKSSWWPLRRPR
jgi:hypothetical protein